MGFWGKTNTESGEFCRLTVRFVFQNTVSPSCYFSNFFSVRMYGVLVDVSGSMKSAYDLDRSRRVNVERTHAILTTVMNIVEKEVAHHEKQELIFVGAFGLDRTVTETCDLLRLLDYVGDPKTDGHRLLSKLAAQHGAQHAEHWIRNHLSQPEAKMLYKALCSNRTLISQLIELLPSRRSGGALRIAERVRYVRIHLPEQCI